VYEYEAPAMVIEAMQPGDGSALMSKIVGVAKAGIRTGTSTRTMRVGTLLRWAKGRQSMVAGA
jgi:hypothetical protein